MGINFRETFSAHLSKELSYAPVLFGKVQAALSRRAKNQQMCEVYLACSCEYPYAMPHEFGLRRDPAGNGGDRPRNGYGGCA